MTNGIAKGADSGYVTEKVDSKPKPSRRKGVSSEIEIIAVAIVVVIAHG